MSLVLEGPKGPTQRWHLKWIIWYLLIMAISSLLVMVRPQVPLSNDLRICHIQGLPLRATGTSCGGSDPVLHPQRGTGRIIHEGVSWGCMWLQPRLWWGLPRMKCPLVRRKNCRIWMEKLILYDLLVFKVMISWKCPLQPIHWWTRHQTVGKRMLSFNSLIRVLSLLFVSHGQGCPRHPR